MSFDLRKVMGVGTDDIDESVLGQPFVQIIQKGSPEFDESHQKHAEKKIAGAKPGDIFSTLSRKILAQPLKVIPVATSTLYTEWKPKSAGGGFVGNQPLTISGNSRYRKGTAGTPDENKEWIGDNELKLTTYFAILYQQGDKWINGLIGFASTQLKHARRWSKEIKNLRYTDMPDQEPPIFSAMWNLSTENDSNDKGGWKGWSIKMDHLLDPAKEQALLEKSFAAYGTEAPRLQAPTPAKPMLENSASADVSY